ncbi:MAG: hypothetical protein OEY24_08275, partial [Candidatus Bathyarchaeota archaeon]|nr:hypothetical protein [Candidatus Bathyarchaeota archaeon]
KEASKKTTKTAERVGKKGVKLGKKGFKETKKKTEIIIYNSISPPLFPLSCIRIPKVIYDKANLKVLRQFL